MSMNISSRTSSLQAYNMALFRGALHPEFFRIDGRCRVAYGEYDFEGWALQGGHVLRFEHDGLCLTEVVNEDLGHLPERGHVTTLPCAGEKDHEAEFNEKVAYMTSIQTETLTDHLYLGTYNEMVDHGWSSQCLMTTWNDEVGKPNLTLLDVQRYSDEVHVQGYHLRSDCCLVLRTQSIFQVTA